MGRCGHCKRMAPVWEELAKRLLDSGVRVAKVDADGETEIGEKFAIQHYPTLKVYEGGKTVDYKGETSLEAMEQFARAYTANRKDKTSSNAQAFNFAAALQKIDAKNFAAPVLALLGKIAGDHLGVYTIVVFLSGIERNSERCTMRCACFV
jgi:thiol-disulfide isomerase/thioredoxin